LLVVAALRSAGGLLRRGSGQLKVGLLVLGLAREQQCNAPVRTGRRISITCAKYQGTLFDCAVRNDKCLRKGTVETPVGYQSLAQALTHRVVTPPGTEQGSEPPAGGAQDSECTTRPRPPFRERTTRP